MVSVCKGNTRCNCHTGEIVYPSYHNLSKPVSVVPTTFCFDCYCPVSYFRLMFTLLVLKCRTPVDFIVIILRFVPTLTVPLQLAQ